MPRRPSTQTIAVLSALAAEPALWRYGYDLGQDIDLKAGSLYPILMRLHDKGLLDSTWEADPPPGRPPRHLYRLTAAGVRFTVEVAVEVAVEVEVAPTTPPPAAATDPAPSPLRRHQPRSA